MGHSAVATQESELYHSRVGLCKFWVGLRPGLVRANLFVSAFVIVDSRLKGGGEAARLHPISQESRLLYPVLRGARY